MGWGRKRGAAMAPRSPGAGSRVSELSLPRGSACPAPSAWAAGTTTLLSQQSRSCPSRARPARPNARGAKPGAKPGLAEHSRGGLGTASTPLTSPTSTQHEGWQWEPPAQPWGAQSRAQPSLGEAQPCSLTPSQTPLSAAPSPKPARPALLPGKQNLPREATGHFPTLFLSFPQPWGPASGRVWILLGLALPWERHS